MTILGQTLDFASAPVFGLWLLWPAIVVSAIIASRRIGRE
jgi:hypothetical protein